ncbi:MULTISPECIES: FMN-binding protein [unclassified Leifsonia]|uniref:FMN-binding protein n=1 Tax=unclassified Leifsonia TaxID=2663824 RepID=UPI0008A7351F|nr:MULTISPECIES: FMN-binding protein [unclassified Leifsonia]SEH61977.1 Uncharacterized protein, contains FMN-binding domain [Leifsonia sp. CL154]SFL17427.1 Uncharacterized protein, contains FMN-binding domain [Leifsonia sp. CL147]
MNSRSWRGTILFTVILVTMGATVGLKLYGIGEQVTASDTSVHAATAAATAGTSGATSTPTPSASASASASPSPSATATPAPAQAAATKTVTGSAIDTRYGAVQVKLTFTGGTITAVDTVQAPDGNGRDQEINQQALPILQQEVLSSQSANIDTVSGATYTSEGYIQSVQSAIDKR